MSAGTVVTYLSKADYSLSIPELTSTSVPVAEIDDRFHCLSVAVLVYRVIITAYTSLVAVEVHVNSCARTVYTQNYQPKN
jgi:hypothetical protein